MEIKLKNDEFPAMQFLHYLRILTDPYGNASSLVPRMRAVGELEAFLHAHDEIDRIFWAMLNTFSRSDKRKFINLTADQKCIVCGKGMGRHANTSTVWTEDLLAVLAGVRKYFCNERTLDGHCGPDEMRTCPFRKPMKSLVVVDIGELEEEKGRCGLGDFEWENTVNDGHF